MFGMNYLSSWYSGTETPTNESAVPDAGTSYPKVADVDLVAFADKSVEVLLARDSGSDKVTTWDLVSEDDGVTIWRGDVEGDSWNAFRCARRITTDKASIVKALLDVELTMELDEMMESAEGIKDAEEGRISLRHVASKGVFPISGREFVIITCVRELPDGRAIIATRSVVIDEIEPFDGYVRATNHVSGYIIKEEKDAQGKVYCDVKLLAHADLGGFIPAQIVNLLGTSSTVKVLEKLQQLIGQ